MRVSGSHLHDCACCVSLTCAGARDLAHSGTIAQDWVNVAIPQLRVSWLTLARLRVLYSLAYAGANVLAHSGTTAQDWVHVAITQVRVSWLTLARLRVLYFPCLCRCQ